MSRIWSHYACITADRQSKHGTSRVLIPEIRMVWGYFNNLEQGQTERDRARVKEKASSCDGAFRSFRAIPAWRQSRFCSGRAASLQRFPSLRDRTLALVHIPHTAGGGSAFLLFRNLRHKRFGGQLQRRDRAGVLQS